MRRPVSSLKCGHHMMGSWVATSSSTTCNQLNSTIHPATTGLTQASDARVIYATLGPRHLRDYLLLHAQLHAHMR